MKKRARVHVEKPCHCEPNPFQCGAGCLCAGCGCLKERPVLFTAGNVCEIRDDRKTQTRRIVKPFAHPVVGAQWCECLCREIDADDQPCVRCREIACGRAPYGTPGDRLWVKETWRPERYGQLERITYAADLAIAFADEIPDGWKRPKAAKTGNVSPLFMPRWASRLTLALTEVRVERLQSISRDDAIAEGVTQFFEWALDPIGKYRELWISIHGLESWNANPWVWAITFKRVEAGNG